jgi:hypothetical protein
MECGTAKFWIADWRSMLTQGRHSIPYPLRIHFIPAATNARPQIDQRALGDRVGLDQPAADRWRAARGSSD